MMKFKMIFLLGLCLNFINPALSGAASAPVPKISATPASVNLGLVQLGASSAPTAITVKNTGKSDLIVSSVNTAGTDSDEFSQTNNCGTIQPGGSCLVNVTFTPVLPYAKKAAILAIASNDPKKSLLNVKLSGQLPPPAISATPASLNFGKLPAGTANASKSVTLTNKGLSDLVIAYMDISGTNPGDFTATSNCGTIQKDGSCTINVLFEPLAPNVTRSASLDISSNDPKKSTVRLKLSGSSIAAKLPPAAPTGVTATPGNGQVTIAWTAAAGATAYNIYWSTTPGVTKSTGTKISGVTSPYTHSSLANGTPYYYVATAVNTYGESAESAQVSATPVQLIPTISSLSTNSAAPMSQLTVTGAGFDPTATLTVSFFDNNGFKLDVLVLEADSTSINVAVPPYISPSTGMFGPGTVNVQVIQNSDGSIVTSNTIQNFQLQDLSTSNTPSGAVTLDLLNGIIDYYIQLQIVLKNTILDIPELNTAIANNIVKLQALAAQIHTVAQDSSASFSLGSINGNNVSVDTQALLATDRMIIGLLKTLSEINPSFSVLTEKIDKRQSGVLISPQTTIPCQQEANDWYNNEMNCAALGQCGQNYNYYIGCSTGGLPVAVKIMNNVIAGAGTVATAVMGLFGAPAIALALPTAVLLNVEAMSIVIQIDVAAAQKNIDEAESYKQMREALDRTEENLRGLIVGKIIPETEGNLKDFYSGLESLYQEFGKTATLVPPPTCTSFTYSVWSACQPDNTQKRTVATRSPDGCEGGTPILSQACTYVPPICTTFTYSEWGVCQPGNTQTRTVISSSPAGCVGGDPVLTRSCTYKGGAFDGTWEGKINGILTYTDGSKTNWDNVAMWLTIKDYVITSDQPYSSVTGTVDGWGNGSWQIVNGYPSFHFTGTFVPTGTASGTWTYSTSFATGNGTWTATRW